MAKPKVNPLKLGLKAAKNISVADLSTEEATQTTGEKPIDVSNRQIKDAFDEEIVEDKSTSEESASSIPKTARNKERTRRGRGRPPGKKSDPKTTQAGGYVDEDLYLEVQITLTQLKRRFTKRSYVNVSTLMGALFGYFQDLSADEQEVFLRKYSDIDSSET